MVRRSTLVYDLLRTEQPPDGFSKNEIVTYISDKYDIAVSKTFRRDIAVALRRGLDFGILAKKRNKFRYNPDFFSTTNSRGNITKRNTKSQKRERSSKKKATGRSNASKGRRQRERSPNRRKGRDRKQSVPPKLPRPPSWSPKRRLLIDEPIPKVKHS